MKKTGLVLLASLATSIAAYTLFNQKKRSDSGVESIEGVSDIGQPSSTQEPPSNEKIAVNSRAHSKNQVDLSTLQANRLRSKSIEVAEPGNPKLKKLSIEEEISQVEKLYPSILNQKGFTEYETEVIVRLQIEEIRSTNKDDESSLVKAARQLEFSEEKKRLLNEAFDQLFVDEIVQFSMADVAECMSSRLKGISNCTRSVLDDYLRDLSLALESDVFIMSQKVMDLTAAARKKTIDTCQETPERANYQFRLVFVECAPI